MLTVVLTVGGQLRYCGVGHGYDDIKVDGNPADLKVRAVSTLLAGTDSNKCLVCRVLLQRRQGRRSCKYATRPHRNSMLRVDALG